MIRLITKWAARLLSRKATVNRTKKQDTTRDLLEGVPNRDALEARLRRSGAL